jgi:serine/threonine-protein kinase
MSEGYTERLQAALDGRYRIERTLGEGGMATVYLAKDLRHNRSVALKVLKPELAAVVGASRFLAEIETTANLQHPHILPLFDSGEADGLLFYVMPHVEGESLRARLDREHQLPVDEAVRIATNVAEALDYAHRQGVIHRDIKPANILLLDGKPVIADFGIALAVSHAGGGRLTETGLSLGTPHYMSPEQATGDQSVGPATDIWALGCVLYEMLVGEPPYTGSTPQAVLGKIITAEPPSATEARKSVPPNVDAAVRKALEKVPADRFRSAEEMTRALAEAGFRYAATATQRMATAGAPSWLDRPSKASLAAALALAAWGAWGWLREPPVGEPGVPTRAHVTGLLPYVTPGGSKFAISPDGRWIVAVGVDGGVSQLLIRSADDPDWRVLPNTRGVNNPTFSPDGQAVAFSVGGTQILRVPVGGGPSVLIATGDVPHWGLNDSIVYRLGNGLYRVGSSGGEPELLMRSDTLQVFRPHMLPNGKGIVFGTANRALSRIALFALESGEVRELLPSGIHPQYMATGHLVYALADGALMGVPFDLETLRVTGSPVTLLSQLMTTSTGVAQVAVSATGTLIYETASDSGDGGSTLVEVSLDGTETPMRLTAGQFDAPRYSPDGRKIAYHARFVDELRIYDVATGSSSQFAFGGYPVWSTTGEYLYFSAPLTGPGIQDGYRRRADGSRDAERLWSRPGGEFVADVSAGDSIIVVREDAVATVRDILLMRRTDEGPVFESFLTAGWNEINGEISPDGRWIAYQSDETGEFRIYVHSFPVITGRHSVSPGLGTDPIWSPGGDRLYYRSDGRVMVVDVRTDPDFEVTSPPVELFDRPEYVVWQNPGPQRTWDIHPDGSRFIVVKSELTDGASNIHLVANWFTELRERMGPP